MYRGIENNREGAHFCTNFYVIKMSDFKKILGIWRATDAQKYLSRTWYVKIKWRTATKIWKWKFKSRLYCYKGLKAFRYWYQVLYRTPLSVWPGAKSQVDFRWNVRWRFDARYGEKKIRFADLQFLFLPPATIIAKKNILQTFWVRMFGSSC